MSESSTTGSHGEAWNLPGNHLAVWSRHREAEAGGVVGRRILGGIFPMGLVHKNG